MSLRPPKNWTEFNKTAEYFTRSYNPESPTEYGTSLAGIMDEELAAQVDVEIPAAEAKATPAKPSKEKKAKKGKKKKGIRVGTVIFYLLYLMLIGAAAYGIHYGLGLLNDWLTVYEASQPDTRSQEIFDEIFANPDWGKIYDMAGLEGTQFEGKDAYVTYMQAKVGDSELTYSKTSAGLSGGQK